MFRLFKAHKDEKAVYIAPIEAICREKYNLWAPLISQYLNKTVVMLTGQSNADSKLIEKYDVIISVPEHWDILSRRWKQRKGIHKVNNKKKKKIMFWIIFSIKL